MLQQRGVRLRHIGHGFLLFRLFRFAFRGPAWHPIVSVAVIVIAVTIAAVISRRRA